jgi:hypothetical protein
VLVTARLRDGDGQVVTVARTVFIVQHRREDRT